MADFARVHGDLNVLGSKGQAQKRPSDHDGAYGLFDEFHEAGFGIISPSRPGYGRTPLSSGKTYKEQPPLYAAMLDKLGVDKVVVHTISGGGPAGYSFAH